VSVQALRIFRGANLENSAYGTSTCAEIAALANANTAGRDLDARDKQLVQDAKEASAHAYAPYSGFAVGAAVRTRSGACGRSAMLTATRARDMVSSRASCSMRYSMIRARSFSSAHALSGAKG
jgi:cytidine deaminase